MMLRPATDRDIPAILAFWNPLIRETTVIFHSTERDAAAVAA